MSEAAVPKIVGRLRESELRLLDLADGSVYRESLIAAADHMDLAADLIALLSEELERAINEAQRQKERAMKAERRPEQST